MTPPRALVFDVNETLLDLSPMVVGFERVFGPSPPMGEWFARLLHGSLLANSFDAFRPFSDLGTDALLAMARRRSVDLDRSEAASLVAGMAGLPAHPDVHPALERIAGAGYEMAALTNGETSLANQQIDNAGLRPLIRKVISVDEVGRFKPDPAPYQRASTVLGVDLSDLMLVAAHDWDVAGAMRAGSRGGFLRRSGGSWSIGGMEPHLVVSGMGGLADALTDVRAH